MYKLDGVMRELWKARLLTTHAQARPHNYEYLRDNQLVFCKDMQDCHLSTQYAGICCFIFQALY